MCLSYSQVLKVPDPTERIGYKCFREDDVGLSCEYGDWFRSWLPQGEWLERLDLEDFRLLKDDRGVSYPYGWHTFRDLESAKVWHWGESKLGVYRVAYRNVLATGTQLLPNGSRAVCDVALEIKILEKVWPLPEDSANPDQCKSC